MKVIEHLQRAESTLFSIEILPPLKIRTIKDLYATLDPLMEFNPPFVDVTYHREEIIYKKREHGLVERIPIRKRPGTVGICATIQNRYGVDTVPHLICGGFTKDETEDALFSLHYLGIDNVLLLRGDAIKSEGRFTPTEGGNAYASDLVQQVRNMNNGQWLHEETGNAAGMSTDFCIGVAAYPEKHFEAANMDMDLHYLKQKVALGADYIVTQMFFNNDHFKAFVEKCRAEGIDVPIIPGLKPITSVKQLQTLPRMFHVDIPNDLCRALMAADTKEKQEQVGIEWAIAQSKDLIEYGVPCLHYYTMSRNKPVIEIARAVF